MVFLANSYPRRVGLHLINVFRCFSLNRWFAMLSISFGGHPWRVEMVAELQILDGIASISSFVTFSNLSILSNNHCLHSLKISVSFASIMLLMKVSTFGSLIPARSYPTEMLNWNPSCAPSPNSFAITWRINHALIYSPIA